MAVTRARKQLNTPERILDVAERLVQVRGYNGFSYADVAAELHITKASLHYHFAGKAELGVALIIRYTERFAEALAEIDSAIPDAHTKLEAYAAIYSDVLRRKRMCLCGILAAEYETLPSAMRDAVARFFSDNEAWLTTVLRQGHADRTVSLDLSPADGANMLISGLEGAMLVARPRGDMEHFQSVARCLIASLTN
jgi:TetR/AcrR family transcriptional regulator, transcriptional repressor for nem operon